MGRFCSNCGQEVPEGSKFFPNCGNTQNNGGNTTIINNYNQRDDNPKIPTRNIVSCIILSIITCGIYSIYWFIVMTDESNYLVDEKSASGGMAFLYTILTCGIYAIYWNYKMGKKMTEAGNKYNMATSDNAVLYVILSLFGFGIINYCLIQSDLNRFSK